MAENVENWVSLRRFAAARGVSLAAVQRAIAAGRLKSVRRSIDGKLKSVELNAGMREWNGNTDIDQAQRAGAPILVSMLPAAADQATNAASEPAAAASPATGAEGSDEAKYLEARAQKQQIEAREAELRYLQTLGRLVSVDELQQVNARRYAAVRDKLLNIPDRMATILAAEREPAAVHAKLTGEIKRVLNELADDADAGAAQGTEERVAA